MRPNKQAIRLYYSWKPERARARQVCYLETDGDESKAMGEDAEELNLTMLGESPVAVGGHCVLPDPAEEGAVHKGLTSSKTNHKVVRGKNLDQF